MSPAATLELDSDRLFPAEPGTRRLARQLYETVAELPIISPHGHVPAQWLADDTPFGDPTSLLITPDHYINRLLHAHGVELSQLGVAQQSMTSSNLARLSGFFARTGASTAGLRCGFDGVAALRHL